MGMGFHLFKVRHPVHLLFLKSMLGQDELPWRVLPLSLACGKSVSM